MSRQRMSESVFELLLITLEDYKISPNQLQKAMEVHISTLNLFLNRQLYRSKMEKAHVEDALEASEKFIIQLELSILFLKVRKIRGQNFMGQVLTINKTAKIFLNPLQEKGLEGEGILLKRINSNHLYEELYLELWKLKFLGDDEDGDNEEVERYILAINRSN